MFESFKKTAPFVILFGMGSKYAHAVSNATCVAQGFLSKLNDAVFYPLIILLTGVALFMFLWGGFRFVLNAHNPSEREKGKSHMIYGIIGLLVMVSAASILAIAANTFDLSSDPSVGCGPYSGPSLEYLNSPPPAP